MLRLQVTDNVQFAASVDEAPGSRFPQYRVTGLQVEGRGPVNTQSERSQTQAPNRSILQGGFMKRTFGSSLNGAFRNALFVVAGIAMLTTFTSPAAAVSLHFGVRCQSSFQDTWAPTINVNAACDAFIAQTQAYWPVDFYFNLHGAQPAFYSGTSSEPCNACGGVDSVDFFVMMTHGTIASNNANYAGYAMWDDNSIAWTPSMRFGDSGKQVKVLATFSCDTLKNGDGLLPSRWGTAFAGGLKLILGAHDLLWDGSDDTAMQDFAINIESPAPIGHSWLDSVYYANTSNNPTVANTGANSADCWSRQGATVSQVMSESALRDGKVGYYCWSNWGSGPQ